MGWILGFGTGIAYFVCVGLFYGLTTNKYFGVTTINKKCNSCGYNCGHSESDFPIRGFCAIFWFISTPIIIGHQIGLITRIGIEKKKESESCELSV